MYEITMNLVDDWIKVVKEVFRGSGTPLEDGLSEEETALIYFRQTLEEEAAHDMATRTLERLREMEATIISHMDSIIVPDIRKRTKYVGDSFEFCWVFNQGEHIVELNSEYRIPL
ncbi:hypothetical protein [Paenibacillus sp. HB172176]|uniref:hypothetical protein n=1 Tax=Paenibacillus sp. HB172176 TaxID=2493690 RepID=UPI00143CB44D|nr:hypothetical protein [Paenibacillus sp. HB172176]